MKRFYKAVTVEAQDGGWRVLLDGRGIKTAGSAPQVLPSQPLAEAMAEEWAAQREELDLTRFPMRDLADYAIDVAMRERDEIVAGLLPYGETDTLCYRADPDEPLHRRQLQVWEPILARAEARYGARFTRVSGIVHKPQPSDTLARLHEVLVAKPPFALAALQMLASLAASLTIALLAQERDEEVDALWDAASLEEEWQAELWGREAEAEERRAQRRTSFALAARFAALSQQG